MTDTIITLPDRAPMFEAVGEGITAFASMEFSVGMIFASLLEPADRARSVAAINSVRSFEAKLKMVDAVASVALSGEVFKTWRNLSCRIGKRKNFRDKLAHWMVSQYPGASSTKQLQAMKPHLVPPFWSGAHMKVMWDPNGPHKEKAIKLSQVTEFTQKTIELTTALLNFGMVIAPDKGG